MTDELDAYGFDTAFAKIDEWARTGAEKVLDAPALRSSYAARALRDEKKLLDLSARLAIVHPTKHAASKMAISEALMDLRFIAEDRPVTSLRLGRFMRRQRLLLDDRLSQIEIRTGEFEEHFDSNPLRRDAIRIGVVGLSRDLDVVESRLGALGLAESYATRIASLRGRFAVLTAP